MKTPIEIHFYNKNNEVIRTYKQDRITWEFLKRAVRITDVKTLDDSSIDVIADFIREFFGRRFSKRALLKYTDVEQLLAVGAHIVMYVLEMMRQNGVTLPNVETAAEK